MGVFKRDIAAAEALLNLTRPDLCDPDGEELHGCFIDDMKGCELDPVLTRAARREEIDEFKSRRVYDVCQRSSMPRGVKIGGVRWFESDKGTADCPRVRSRLVAQ